MGVQPEASMAQQLLTVAEVAAQLRVSTMTIYRLIRSGELPAVRVGRNYRVRADELEVYLQAQVVDPATLDLRALADEDLHRDAGG
jgi:excisionase family DNA binding protein